MSLREPRNRRTADYSRAFLDQLHRQFVETGRPSASFTDLCDRASIPRDLRAKLLNQLMTEKYITREGDTVRITPAGTKVATTPSI